MFFFPQRYEKVEGGRGKGVHLGFSGNVFFIVERLGRGKGYKFIMGQGKGCTLIFFLLFFTVEGEGGGG